MNKLRKLFKKDVEKHGGEWLNKQPMLLGNHSAVVQSDEEGVYYARQYNGRVVKVVNTAKVPPTFDLHVVAGESRMMPNTWQIIQVRETFLTPAAQGEIAYHAKQHKINGGDRLEVDRKQIMALNVLVYDAAGFIVRVYGANTITTAGLIEVATQEIDLSSYVITSGAKFVALEMDEDGIITVLDGAVFGAPELATIADMPPPTAGSYLIAHVSIRDGQTELVDDDIVQPWPLAHAGGGGAGDVAGDTNAAPNKATPVDADKFPIWDSVTSLLAHVTWANIKATLKTYFDTLYALAAHVHAHSSLTGIGANDHHAQDHAHNATDAQKLTQANSHQTPDTDTGAGSLHHTIGAGANQAAAGNHAHAAAYAALVHVHTTNGWHAGTGTWSYTSADAPIFVASIPDADAVYMNLGTRIILVQTTEKYFLVHAKGAPSGGFTPVTLFGGTLYTLANAAITLPSFSNAHSPVSFPMNDDVWSHDASSSVSASKVTPTQNLWYGGALLTSTGLSIDVPIGAWRGGLKGVLETEDTTVTDYNCYITLSTANNSEIDNDLTGFIALTVPVGTFKMFNVIALPIKITVAVKTTYYVNIKTSTTTANQIWMRGDVLPTTIKLVSNYL